MKNKLMIGAISAQLLVTQGIYAQTPALEEVIVKAEKREQNLQDIPASISAFSAAQIELAGWDDISQLETSVPSVSVGGDGDSRPFIFIRGVGSRKFDIGSEGSVGVFVDEIYNARFSSSLSGIVDIERIEVLKGPQGTLYGRNTIGGAISLYTVKASEEFEARIKVAAGNEGYWRVGGYVSGAISENWVGRLSASTRSDDGNMTEVLSGKNDGQDADAVRVNLIGQLTDRTSVELTAQTSRLDQEARLAQANGEIGPLGLYQLGHAVPLPVLPPPIIDSILSGIRAGTVANILREAALDPRNVKMDRPGFSELESDLVSLKIEHESDNFLFTSISSRTSDEIHEQTDFESTTRDAIWTDVRQDSKQLSQEFRLTSVDGGMFTLDDRLTWVVGFYYFNDEGYRKDDYSVGVQGNIPPQYYRAVPGLAYSQARQDVTLDNTSIAFYGQATYALTDRLNLTLGIRRSDDEKDFTTQMITNTPGYPFVAAPFTLPQTLKFDSTDPKVSVDYAITDNSMAYITYSSGYKSGGVTFATWAEAGNVGGFEEEHLDSLEIGYKARLMNNRMQLNLAAYQYDYTDQQVQSIVVVNGAPQGLTDNAAESDMKGVELEMSYLLTDALKVDVNYFYQDAVFEDYADKTGNPMQFAPENAYTVALSYAPDLANNLQMRAEYSYKDEFQFDAGNRDISLEPEHDVVNLTASMDLGDSVSLRLFCNNCSDELIRTQVTTFATSQGGGGRSIYGPGRRYGAEITYNF
ncbi:TonB-dependent receptor [Luminiphilus sp.]|nr:TonB-dependent receptor [Luminiphilus sp.]MDB4049280.1 TonB-dependent receptor [Luminiphilus sp.]